MTIAQVGQALRPISRQKAIAYVQSRRRAVEKTWRDVLASGCVPSKREMRNYRKGQRVLRLMIAEWVPTDQKKGN